MSNLFYDQLEKESKNENNSLYKNALKHEKYDKKYTIEEALKMAYDFRKWIEAQIDKLVAEEVVKKVLEEVFKEGETHADLGD